MLHFKQASKKVLCISGVVAMLCMVVLLLGRGNLERSPAPATVGHSMATASVDLSASFNAASTIHRSPADRTHHCHFSSRVKNTVKLLLGKGATIPGLYFQRLAIQPAYIASGYSSTIAPPGHILFLFRYALF